MVITTSLVDRGAPDHSEPDVWIADVFVEASRGQREVRDSAQGTSEAHAVGLLVMRQLDLFGICVERVG